MSELYLISPPAIGPDFADLLARALDAGPVACFQLRLKNGVSGDELRRTINALRPVVQSRDAAFLLNDDPQLAVETGCDGAHLGQDDLAVHGGLARVRQVLDRLSFGVTCHNSRHLAMEAAEAGADYVAFGAFFPTGTKVPKTIAEPGILRWWSEVMEVPCVGIGGITAENCRLLIEAGADFLAVSAAVWSHPNGAAAGVRAMNAAIAGQEI